MKTTSFSALFAALTVAPSFAAKIIRRADLPQREQQERRALNGKGKGGGDPKFKNPGFAYLSGLLADGACLTDEIFLDATNPVCTASRGNLIGAYYGEPAFSSLVACCPKTLWDVDYVTENCEQITGGAATCTNLYPEGLAVYLPPSQVYCCENEPYMEEE